MRSRRGIFTLATLTALLTAGPAGAQTYVVQPTTATIEEDWKIVVAHGDAAKDGPQMMTYMSPVGDSSSPYAWFMLNVRDNPNPYTPGGLMIQVWDYADTLITSNTSGLDTAKLNAANETITWTQELAWASPNSFGYQIFNGSSTTWGTFGSLQGMSAVNFTGPGSLNGYSPYVSVKNSRVGWMASNVTSMTLLTVRQIDKQGKVLQADTLNLAVNLAPQ